MLKKRLTGKCYSDANPDIPDLSEVFMWLVINRYNKVLILKCYYCKLLLFKYRKK